MVIKFQPHHENRSARIRQLEARCERLTQLLDELWNVATDALGDNYCGEESVPEGFASTLHVIAERAASALDDVVVA